MPVEASSGGVRYIDSAAEALQYATLSDIIYYEVSARRLEPVPSETSEDLTENKEKEEQTEDISILERHDELKMEVRCKLQITTSDIELAVDAASQFNFSEPIEMNASARAEFVAKVGIMAVYPYLRESAHAVASKLRVEPPLVSLISSGDVSVTPIADGE
ncbi:hypothetical protein AB1207_24110 [Kineococcus endophyticus]|uniref:Uncharacterized protein n=1 Tax=Kineococcus endophyticus TaxID=1181883 RepID=A0ABV3PDW6_9ACTN